MKINNYTKFFRIYSGFTSCKWSLRHLQYWTAWR